MAQPLSFLVRGFVRALRELPVGIEGEGVIGLILWMTKHGPAFVERLRSLGNIGKSRSAQSLLSGCEGLRLDPGVASGCRRRARTNEAKRHLRHDLLGQRVLNLAARSKGNPGSHPGCCGGRLLQQFLLLAAGCETNFRWFVVSRPFFP